MKRRIVALSVTAFAVGLAPASVAEEPKPWKGNLEFSYLRTGGNTSSESLLFAGKGERSLTRAKLTGEFIGLYGEKSGIASDKNWQGRLKYDRFFSDRIFAYVSETVDRNPLKGIEIRYATQVGAGYEFIKTPTDILTGEIGLGWVRENPVTPFDDRGYANARAFGQYEHAFTDKTRFTQTVEYLPSLKESKDYIVNEETALVTNLMGSLAFKVSYSVSDDNLPPPTFFKTDRLFKTALLWTF
jgi:putative salt-induced outer membrane protein YdiY